MDIERLCCSIPTALRFVPVTDANHALQPHVSMAAHRPAALHVFANLGAAEEDRWSEADIHMAELQVPTRLH
jgi:hypothetical protein